MSAAVMRACLSAHLCGLYEVTVYLSLLLGTSMQIVCLGWDIANVVVFCCGVMGPGAGGLVMAGLFVGAVVLGTVSEVLEGVGSELFCV